MNKNKISVSEAIKQIKNNNFNSESEIKFEGKKIDALDAILLGKNGIDVPEELIEYDDDKIDYSDIPAIIDEDIKSGKIQWTINTELALDKEIRDWIKK